MTLGLFTTLG